MKTFQVRRLTEGEHRGKLAVFDGGVPIGLGELDNGMSRADQEQLVRLKEGKGRARVILADLISNRMGETGESFDLAQLNIVRTREGRDLWERIREDELYL